MKRSLSLLAALFAAVALTAHAAPKAKAAPKKVLIVLTSTDHYAKVDKKTGFWAIEAFQPYADLTKAGYAVDFGALFAAVVITIVPVLVVYLIFQRRLEGSVSQGTFR